MTLTFVHETLGQRVLFGTGRAREHLAAEIERHAASRVMVIAAEPEAELADELTAGLTIALRWSEVAQHVPVEAAERARAAASQHDIDLLVSVGGGSTTGMAKAIALSSGLPIVAVPTTYAGSEATNVWGLTEGSRKTTGVDARVLPAAVVYDAALTLSLPVALSVASGLNAIAHCVDSMWAPRTDPINRALATEGIRALTEGLRAIHADSQSPEGREQSLYGAYLAAVAFASAGSGMHHKICHVLGGTYNLPHAETHATVLPYVLAYNAPFAVEASARLAEALGSTTALAGLLDLKAQLRAPHALRDYGFDAGRIPEAARLCAEAIPESNPRPVTVESLQELLRAAWAGTAPSALEEGAAA
jgi:maleylacetate reductase